ncbi:uncharacterized protein [Oryctolagus cuniculus]|uniref:uncharacterized protein n=1 Tax=Oryctolagus cuniculus TaxID=9986 RepID=UPI003879DF51
MNQPKIKSEVNPTVLVMGTYWTCSGIFSGSTAYRDLTFFILTCSYRSVLTLRNKIKIPTLQSLQALDEYVAYRAGNTVSTVSFPVLKLISKMHFVLNLEGQAGLDYSQSFPGGEFAVCEPCRLGRGKCRKVCLENEKISGNCKLNYFCCRHRI